MDNKKVCITCLGDFEITKKEQEFIKQFEVPAPDECYECRLKKMMSFWPSIWRWYNRKCDATGDTIITNYPANARFSVYKMNYFNSDSWTPDFLELDFNKSFFSQFKTLQEKTPRPHQLWDNIENCLYCDDIRNSKSCYLSSSILDCENLYYSYRNLRCKDSTDLVFCWDINLSTSLVFWKNCYKVNYSVFVTECSESMFLYDCKNVKNCFMSWNLRNKQYCIKNKQYSKDEYFKKLWEYDFWSRKVILNLKNEFEDNLKNEAYHPENRNEMSENVDWNFVTNSKNIENWFLIEDSEDSVNCFRWIFKYSMDGLSILESDKCYSVNMSAYIYNIKFSSYSIRCKNSEYLDNCVDLDNCFLCVWIKNKKYNILNKEYSKEEYEELLPKIKMKMWKDWEYWKFLPYSMMYTGYNTTIARLYFPETKESVAKLWWYWEDWHESIQERSEIIELPDNISDISESKNWITVTCEKTKKNFNFINEAILLHKKLNAPLFPLFHVVRIVDGYSYLTNFKKFTWKCSVSGTDITHYYPPKLWYKNIVSNKEYNRIVNS